MSFGSKSLPPPTEDEARRIEACKAYGCVACKFQKYQCWSPIEYHHFVRGIRIGHRYGIALCTWHHQGDQQGYDVTTMNCYYGPSLKLNRKAFIQRYGTDQELLDKQDDLIGWPCVKIERQKKANSRTQRSSKTIPKGKRGVDL